MDKSVVPIDPLSVWRGKKTQMVTVIKEPGNKSDICVYHYVLSYSNKSVHLLNILTTFQMNFTYTFILVILATWYSLFKPAILVCFAS